MAEVPSSRRSWMKQKRRAFPTDLFSDMEQFPDHSNQSPSTRSHKLVILDHGRLTPFADERMVSVIKNVRPRINVLRGHVINQNKQVKPVKRVIHVTESQEITAGVDAVSKSRARWPLLALWLLAALLGQVRVPEGNIVLVATVGCIWIVTTRRSSWNIGLRLCIELLAAIRLLWLITLIAIIFPLIARIVSARRSILVRLHWCQHGFTL